VPGLILQPLVENAVGHGIAPLAEGGTVWIRSHVRNATLQLEVEDDGAGLASGDSDWIREGHGLANVRDRLRTLYAEQGMLDLAPGRGGRGAVASIALPVAGGPRSAPAVAGTAERPSRAAGSGR
jgi:LytS/YehU family sensor histidine kinase